MTGTPEIRDAVARVAAFYARPTGEYAAALKLADSLLCDSDRDPDSDLSILARQFLRRVENIHTLIDDADRLKGIAKGNNTLARMNGEHRDKWRARAMRLADALEPFVDASSFIEIDGREDAAFDASKIRVGHLQSARDMLRSPRP